MDSFFEPNADPLSFLELESPSSSTFQPPVDLGKRSSVAVALSGHWSGSTDSTLPLSTPSPPAIDFSPTNEIFPPYSFLFYGDNSYSTSNCHEYYPFEPEADEFLKGYDDAYHGNSFGQPLVNTLPAELGRDLLSPKCDRQSSCTQTISPKQLIAPLPTPELSTAREEASCAIPPSPPPSPSPVLRPPPLSSSDPVASTVCSDSLEPIPVVSPTPSVARRSKRKEYSTLLDDDADMDEDEYRCADDSADSDYRPEHPSPAKSSVVDRRRNTARLSNKKAKAKFATQQARQKTPKKPTPSPSKRRRGSRPTTPPPSPSRSPSPEPDSSAHTKFTCHVIWSTGEPCTQSFQRPADLIRHLTSVHNERQIRCEKCHGTYSRSDALERHIKKGCVGRARKRRRRNYELNTERSSRMRLDEDDEE
ncbi:hypothetical protein BD410DRAFT_60480 [Rickenella mellea]|uniref:C2H2-type domain-containing protein n=1 Tax=Rickenella mellea TaxID=50990 RepID=A0A4Y7QAS4_9AGAM|nr:hypothetical protein BD410DRAFT_60480 [Rickenella mellea]